MNSQEKMRKKIKKSLKQFWIKYESKIALTIGMILVAILTFEVGILQGQKWQQMPLIIEKPAQVEATAVENKNPAQAQNLAIESQKTPETSVNNPKECAFVGSKNSTKYHKSTCQWAKRIKPENMVCFKSEEDARSKGYAPCSSCVK